MNETLLDGMTGEPLPYLLRTDGMITGLVLLCLLLAFFVTVGKTKYLQSQLKSLVSLRERASMFDEGADVDLRYTLVLVFHACVQVGFCLYDYFSKAFPALFDHFSHGLLLVGFVGFSIIFVLLKWLLYGFVNAVFFPKGNNLIWSNVFFNVWAWCGFLLLPIVLLKVYFDLSSQISILFIGFIIIIAKITLFYRCYGNFFGKIYGWVHLILYFCALEILPDLLAWKGIEIVSNNLTLNL